MPNQVLKHSIHWFRKGMRLHDNPALLAACQGSHKVWPVFILDPWFVKNMKVGPNRWRFLVQTLTDLDQSLKKLNLRLYVLHGSPKEVFSQVIEEWKVTHLTFEVDTEPYAKERDAEIVKLAESMKVTVTSYVSHTLYSTEKVIEKNGGNAPLTYQSCQGVLNKLGKPDKPVPTLTAEDLKGCDACEDYDRMKCGIPSLEDLGVKEGDLGECLYPGGEKEGLERLQRYMEKKEWVCNFSKPDTAPNSLEPSTTVLSPYLKFGCISSRTFYWKLQDILTKSKKHTQPPVSLVGQLLWREFFHIVGSATPNFDKMEGNPVCRQIPWGTNPDHLEAWKNGQTGYPFIDALMTQLRQEGWIHHLGRHAVACFLTRGDLWISWEEGQKVFEEYLLDADWSLNAGNWMWLSASAFFHQYFRVYSPVAFGKKTDKQGAYIKKYLPQLKKFPADLIYEPWKASSLAQQAAGCIIGKDYPKPIVDHDQARQENIKRMAAAYKATKDPGVNPNKKRLSDTTSKSPAKKVKKHGRHKSD